ncbi:MAG: hypothetical protein H6Q71_1803 [Firmicutes bacterium]|nr:hypothetical protein [Bacillota bacterium]
MSNHAGQQTVNLVCVKCGINLTLGKIALEYLGSNFPVELYK